MSISQDSIEVKEFGWWLCFVVIDEELVWVEGRVG